MNNSNRRAAAVDGEAAVSGGRSTRLPHLRYTGLFSDKRIERPTDGGQRGVARPFTSFGRPWFEVESSSQSVNSRSSPSTEEEDSDSHLSSSVRDVEEENKSRTRDVAISNNHRVVGKGSGTGEPKYNTPTRDSSQIGHRSGNADAVESGGAAHVLGFLPPPPEFSDTLSCRATVPRCSMSRMFLESKSISSAPTTVLDRPKRVVEKAKDSGSDDDGVNDDDDDDDDVSNDVPPPPLPTSSPPKIPFSFLHTELENDAVLGDEQKPKTTLALSVRSLFGVESDSSESREDDIRTELFSSNDEINKFSGTSIPSTERRTRVEESRGAAANGYGAAAKEVAPSKAAARGETVKSNGGCPPVLSSSISTKSESFRATASKSNADRRSYNTTDQKQAIERTSQFEGVDWCNAKNADNIARDSPQRNETSFRNDAHSDYTPTTTKADFTEPPHRKLTSAEDPFSISSVRPNPNDKDYGIDRVIDQRVYTVDSVRNQSKERRDRSKGSEAVRHIGIANLMNTNAKNQTDEADGRRSERIDGYNINGSHFDDSTQERRDYYGNKTSSLLPSSHHKVNTDVDLLNKPNKPDRPPAGLAEKEKCVKSKTFISTLSLYQQESEDGGSPRNSLKKHSTFENLEKKLRDDARDRLKKLKSPNGSSMQPSFPASGSCLPVIANPTSTRGALLSRENRRSPNYETVLFPPRFGFQPPSFSGSLSRRKPGSLEDLKDWGTRSLPRNMECTDKWSVAKFDESIDDYRKEEEEATEDVKDNRSSDEYYENRKKSTNESDKYNRDGGYHRLAFSLPRPAKSAVKLQLQSADAGNINKYGETATKEMRQNKTSDSKPSKTNYSYPRTFATASQPDSNLIASNSSALSVFVPPVPPITADFPDSTVTHPHLVYQNPVQKSSFSTEATSVPRSFASGEILPNISQIPIAFEDKIIPPYSTGHSISRISSSSSVASPKLFSGNHLTQSTTLDFSEALSHLHPDSSAFDSVSDSASTASAPVEFSGGGEHLPGPPGDGGPSPQLNESREDIVDSELDASFTYFRISHKNNNNNQTETEPPPPPPKNSASKYRSSVTVSLSSADSLIVSDADELGRVPSNQRPLVNGLKDAMVSSFAGTRQLTEPPEANYSSFENSVDPYLRSVDQSQVVDAMQSKKFAANEDEFSNLRTSKTNESKENLRWKPLRRERSAEYRQKDPLGNGNTDNSQSAVERNGVCGVHSYSMKFSDSLTNNESVASNKRETEVHSPGHHKLHLVDGGQTTPKTEHKTSEEPRPESIHSTIGTARAKTYATELSTKAPLPEYGADETLKRYEIKRKPWSTGRETENQNQIGKEGTPRNVETPSSSISRWRSSDKNEDRGIPPSLQGHTIPPTPEGGSTAKDSRTRNRMRGSETSSLVGNHRTTEADRGKMVRSSTEDDNRGGNDLIRIEIVKGSLGICFCLEGGRESPHGDGPIRIKRIFHVGAPDFSVGSEKLCPGDELISVNGQDFTSTTHYAAWKHLRTLPEGVVTLVVRRALAT